MTLSLRAGRPGDAEVMAAIHASVAAPGWSAPDFATWLKRGDAFAVLVCSDGEPVAFALALGAGDDADVLMVATASQMQRRGAARTALQALALQSQVYAHEPGNRSDGSHPIQYCTGSIGRRENFYWQFRKPAGKRHWYQ